MILLHKVCHRQPLEGDVQGQVDDTVEAVPRFRITAVVWHPIWTQVQQEIFNAIIRQIHNEDIPNP